jgi:hypothetical protein
MTVFSAAFVALNFAVQSPATLITMVVAAAALAAVIVLIASVVSTSRTTALPRVTALREKSWRVPGRAGALRQRDPDSAGHARPRAPAAAPAAASC